MLGTVMVPTCVPVLLKRALRLVPNSVAPVTIAKATRIMTSAYSRALAPLSSCRKRLREESIALPPGMAGRQPRSSTALQVGDGDRADLGADAVEQRIEIVAQQSGAGDDHEGDENHDESVFERVRTAFVLKEA